MEFKFVQDVEAPSEFVYEQITDFDGAEEAAMRVGVEATRTDDVMVKGPGMKWDVTANIRRRTRKFKVEILLMKPPKGLNCLIKGQNIQAYCKIECMSMNVNLTRLVTTVEIEPKNLRGRLLIQSLRLARGRVLKQAEKGLGRYARKISDDYKAIS